MRPHTPPYLQSEGSEEDGSDGTEGRVVVAELVAKDMEELKVLREAWGGLPAGPAKVAAREAYFKFLLSWRWELKAVDREHVAEWFDKDPNAMLVLVTMLTPPRAGRRSAFTTSARPSLIPGFKYDEEEEGGGKGGGEEEHGRLGAPGDSTLSDYYCIIVG